MRSSLNIAISTLVLYYIRITLQELITLIYNTYIRIRWTKWGYAWWTFEEYWKLIRLEENECFTKKKCGLMKHICTSEVLWTTKKSSCLGHKWEFRSQRNLKRMAVWLEYDMIKRHHRAIFLWRWQGSHTSGHLRSRLKAVIWLRYTIFVRSRQGKMSRQASKKDSGFERRNQSGSLWNKGSNDWNYVMDLVTNAFYRTNYVLARPYIYTVSFRLSIQ